MVDSAMILAAHPYAPILVLILVAIVMVGVILVLAHALGPRRRGPVKDDTYESGMPPFGDARRRFHVKFYLLALLFLLFDVEVVFMWPWAPVFHDAALRPEQVGLPPGVDKTFLLGGMAVFFGILVVGYAYDWWKGVFRWS
ncbi:MAG: NADH-quinone oxidoreductase subunit A [Phycisphaerae bacterium]|jgi:NADH-quinone oxidoreductase subunit A